VHHLAAFLQCEGLGSAEANIQHNKHKKSLEYEQNGLDVSVNAAKAQAEFYVLLTVHLDTSL
jgi:hypothetical protein